MSLPATARAARDLAAGWLQHRPVDDRGLPIPWINRWGPETVASTRISWDPNVARPAVFHDDTGDVVDFTRQNFGRQRESMTRGLCQVCGRFTPWSRRNLVISGNHVESVQVADLGGRRAMAVHEPWLDDRCAAIATLLCPALIRRRHDEQDLTVLPVRREKDVQLIVAVGTLDLDQLADAEQAHPDHVTRLRSAIARGLVATTVKAVLLNQPIAFRDDSEAPADTAGASGHARV